MDVLRAEEPVDAGAVQAWQHEAEVGREAGDGVGEEIVEREGDGELAPALLRERELAGGGGEELLVLGGLAGEHEERGGGWGSAAAAMLGCGGGSGDPARTSMGRLASAGGGSNRSSAAADRLGSRRRLVLE